MLPALLLQQQWLRFRLLPLLALLLLLLLLLLRWLQLLIRPKQFFCQRSTENILHTTQIRHDHSC
jgi:hypothetical protein